MEKIGNKVLRASAAILIMTLISSYVISGTLAKYVTSANSDESASVAAFVFELNDGAYSQMVDLSGIKKPGDEKIFTFSVSNSRTGGMVSEVAMNYIISLQLNGSIPLEATITSAGTQTAALLSAAITEGNATTLPQKSSTATATTAQSLSFSAGSTGQNTYTLTVTWPKEQNDSKYASAQTAAEAILTVTAEQTD
jgi:hypothetical protein